MSGDRSTYRDARGNGGPREEASHERVSGRSRIRTRTWDIANTKTADLSVPGPSGTWVFIDEREDTINDVFFYVDMAGMDNAAATVIEIFRPATTLAVVGCLRRRPLEIHKWRDPDTTCQLTPQAKPTVRLMREQRGYGFG